MQRRTEQTPEQPADQPRWQGTDPAQRHLVVVGFKGSYYDPIGGKASHHLRRPPFDPFSRADIMRAWLTDTTNASRNASKLELAACTRLLSLPPQVAFMRAATYALEEAQVLLQAAQSYVVFVDTPPEICERRIRHPERAFSLLEQLQARQDLELYDQIAPVTRAAANLVLAGTVALEQQAGIDQAAENIVMAYRRDIPPAPRYV